RESVVTDRGVILPGDDSVGIGGLRPRSCPCAFNDRAQFARRRQVAVAPRSLAVLEIARGWRGQNAGWAIAPAARSCSGHWSRINADGAPVAVACGAGRRG